MKKLLLLLFALFASLTSFAQTFYATIDDITYLFTVTDADKHEVSIGTDDEYDISGVLNIPGNVESIVR